MRTWRLITPRHVMSSDEGRAVHPTLSLNGGARGDPAVGLLPYKRHIKKKRKKRN